MTNHTRIAIDLAKSIFQVCIINGDNTQLMNKRFRRNKLIEFIRQQAPCRVAMEACYSSHYWGRVFTEMGHQVELIPAQHVKAFLHGNKNDANDALAIAEAAARPGMICVPVKSTEQQDVLALHRIRERSLAARLRLTNQTRGLLSEYGITFPQGNYAFRLKIAELIADETFGLSTLIKEQLQCAQEEYQQYEKRLAQLKITIESLAKQNPLTQQLLTIPGIGPVIATAMVASIGNGAQFSSPREFAVWLGLTPKQYASGHKNIQSGITKRGDRYLRKQLVHGARAALRWTRKRDDAFSHWANQLVARRGYNKACVALAHKLARYCWILLSRNEAFRIPV